MGRSFDERVSQQLFKLSGTEDEIVDFLRRNKEALPTIREIARELGISGNTVFRLAKKLGYSGWAEMRFAIENAAKEAPSDADISPLFSPAHIDKEATERLLRKMDGAATTMIYGIGDSKYFSELLVKYIRFAESLGTRRVLYDSDYTAERLQPGDVAILISSSGTTPMVLRVAETAKARGAFLASITLDTDNPLRNMADLGFVFRSNAVNNRFIPDLTGLMMQIRYIAETYWSSIGKTM